jgi:RNA polymerase sigma-70 factor, ECF subfamily
MPIPARKTDPWLLRAQRGDAKARRALVERHGPRIWGLCRRLAPADAADCYQRIWEKVFVALPGFEPSGPASLDTWIGTIARRTLIDHHRRRRVRGEVVELGELRADEPDPEMVTGTKRRHARLDRALLRLPAAQRRAVVAHHLQGVPLATLAREEEVSLGTIKSRLHRGRGRLAQLLGEES